MKVCKLTSCQRAVELYMIKYMDKLLRISLFSATYFLFFLLFPLSTVVHAQLQGCGEIDVGNPGNNQQPPAQCQSGDGSVVWPYPNKTPSQNRRVDQGWDLEYTSMGNNVRAVVSGTINVNHGPNPCNGGSGFGDTYPIEVMDKPVIINGRKYTEIYYGHTADIKLGKVKAGDIIAKTWDCVNLGAGYIPWLEIGFWGPGGPLGTGYSFCKLDNAGDTSKNTQAGCDMKQWLNSNTK